MERKRDAKLFLFYVNINYRIFHVYNNLLLATSGVVVVDVDKMPVPFPPSLAGNDVVVVVIAVVSFELAADTFVAAPPFTSPIPFVKLADESVAKPIVDSDAFAEFAVVAVAAAAAAAAFFSSIAKRSFFFV